MMSVQIILPDGTVYQESADSIKILLEDGWMGIQENHSPLIAKLADGEVHIALEKHQKKYLLIQAFFHFKENKALILAESAQIL